MDSLIIIQKLKKLIEAGIKIGEIEAAVGFPKNNLSAVLKGKKPLAEKWVGALDKYLNTQNCGNKEPSIEDLKFVIKSLDEQAFVVMEDGSLKKLKGEETLVGYRTLTEYLRISGATVDDLISVHKSHLVRYAGIDEALKKQKPTITTTNNKQPLEVKIQNLNDKPKTNYTINTLDQLKASCPPELTGLDRSVWISEQRVKYNI